MNEIDMNETLNTYKSKEETVYIENTFMYLSILGFILVAVGAFLKFLPLIDGSWINIGIGRVVLIGCSFGLLAQLRKNNFASFFISIFILYYLFHEIIIFYDNYAINLGKELTDDGVYRSVIAVLQEALKPVSGAFICLVGGLVSLISSVLNWIYIIIKDNKNYDAESN